MDPVLDHMKKNLPAGELSPDCASPHPPPPPVAGAPSAASSHTSIDISASAPTEYNGPNPYAAPAPARSASMKVTMETMRDVLGRWGKKVRESRKAAEDLSRNVWQHLKTGPSIAEAAMGRLAQTTKVIAEGGHDKIFRQTFDNLPDEQLKHYFACYLSTSAGPVMGTLYISTAKVAFSSDNPLSYKVGKQTEWSYYKVVIPLHQLRVAKSSGSEISPAERYIQVVSVDNHEFWFMGFVSYENAVKNLEEVMKDVHGLHA